MFGLSGFLRHGSSVARTILFVMADPFGGVFHYTKTGSGVTTMAALHTYTGPTVIKAGTLSVSVLADGGVASHVGASSSAASNLVLNEGGLTYTGGTASIDRDITIISPGFLSKNSITVANSVDLTVGGLVTDAVGLNTIFNKYGAGRLIIGKASPGLWGGHIAIFAGHFVAGVAGAIPESLSFAILPGAVLDLNGFDLTVTTVSQSGSVYLGAATLTCTGSGIYSGNISGTGGLTKTTTGMLQLTGANSTYTGPTTILGGIIYTNKIADGGSASGIGASSAAASNLVLSGGTLRYAGATVSSDRGLTLADSTNSIIEVLKTDTTLTLSGGTAATTGMLVKAGQGVLVLGPMLHTGLTTIGNFGGALYISTSAAGSVTLNNSVGGRTGVGSAATATIAGNLTHANGGLSAIDVHTNGSNVASRFDVAGVYNGGNNACKVNVLGALDIGDYIIVSAASHTGSTPTIGTNSSGHSASLSLVAGVLTLHIT